MKIWEPGQLQKEDLGRVEALKRVGKLWNIYIYIKNRIKS